MLIVSSVLDMCTEVNFTFIVRHSKSVHRGVTDSDFSSHIDTCDVTLLLKSS